MDWLVKKAVNADVERQHLNKILQEIKAKIDSVVSTMGSVKQQDVPTIVGGMVNGNVERGIDVSYNPQRKTLDFVAKDFTISLRGAVRGSGTVSGLNSVIIDTVMDAGSGSTAPADSNFYWQHNGQWEIVAPEIADLQYLEGQGILVRLGDENDPVWTVREIVGTAGEIDVADGDAVADNPTLSLADVADAGGGELLKTEFDTKGRKIGSSPANLSDLADVDLTALADGFTIEWNAAENKWEAVEATGTQLFQRMTADGDFRITVDGHLRVCN